MWANMTLGLNRFSGSDKIVPLLRNSKERKSFIFFNAICAHAPVSIWSSSSIGVCGRSRPGCSADYTADQCLITTSLFVCVRAFVCNQSIYIYHQHYSLFTL